MSMHARRAGMLAMVMAVSVADAQLTAPPPPPPPPPPAPLLSPAPTNPATTRSTLFDPNRHMRVSEVRRGMKGYGLTVFHGTKIERFDIEVVDVVRNFNPGFSAVLIICKDDRLIHSGAVQGMSGSPIFLTDDVGKDRMIGAFAFGWALGKDPLVGVQPIEYMLDVVKPLSERLSEPSKAVATGGEWDYRKARATLLSNGFGIGLDPRVNLSVSGMSPSAIDRLSPVMKQMGVINLHASMGGAPPAAGAPATIEPGSSLAVPILTGDIEMAALGTCTEVIGKQVFGFGHPFQNSGEAELPMSAGWVNTVVATLSSSFKLGAATKTLGVLRSDTACGVGGTFGGDVRMVPLSVRVVYDDGSVDRTLNFQAASHPRLTALAAVTALQGSLSSIHELPNEHTVSIESVVKYEKAGLPKELKLGNVFANSQPMDLLISVGLPVAMLADSPFGKAETTGIETTVRVSREAKIGEITAARASRARYRAGETVTIFADYTKFGGVKGIQRLSLPLPAHLPAGDYSVVVSDAARFTQDEASGQPERMFADTLAGAMAVVQAQAAHKSNQWYVRLAREPDGVSLGRVGLPKLPGSKRQLLTNSAKPNLSMTSRPTVVITPAEFVISGAAEFTISVLPEAGVKPKTAGGTTPVPPPGQGPSGPKPAAEPTAPPAKPGENGLDEN